MDFFDEPSVRTARRTRATPPTPTPTPTAVEDAAAKAAPVHPPSGAGAYTEAEVAELIGVSQPTLRNWRVGYKNAAGYYPPKLTEGKHWYKLRQSKRAPVMFDAPWVDEIAEAKQKLKDLGL